MVVNSERTVLCLLLAAILMIGLASCASPFDSRAEDADFASAIQRAVDREVASMSAEPRILRTTAPPSPVAETLRSRADELQAMSPATDANQTQLDFGPDLRGEAQTSVALDLTSAIATAVGNNLSIASAELQPAINEADVINAEAMFDFVLFGSANYTRTDEPARVPVLNGIPLGTPVSASDSARFETGIRKMFESGGTITASTDLSRLNSRDPGIGFAPDPGHTGAVRLGYDQPLLRGFGSDVNTATIRIAENAHARAVEDLTIVLLDVVASTEQAYWNLVFAWNELEIRQWLVDEGVSVRDTLQDRLDFDTNMAEFSDAVARVEQRKADVIRARRSVRAASDSLKRLLNDENLSVGSEELLHPADGFLVESIEYDLREALLTGITNRPELRIALLSLDDAAIAQRVADNARLPLLNLTAELAYLGLDDSADDAYDRVLDADFVDYLVGLTFEYPIGNRAADADHRAARLRRTQSLVAYRDAVQAVALDVKSALRDVVANYELIEATRSSRIAQAENLRTLLVEEDLRGLTPEFLNLKFQRQESLASARSQELQAHANFDQAVAALHRAMGVGLGIHGIGIEPATYDEID